ncbi:hypothetical protein FACS1894187_23410 [Synergistales bacterium]|nr:hypothetical protein FACS1894187_23410 [Synergistales bacterium]
MSHIALSHGSNIDFDSVDLAKSRDKRDFGRGFYMTTLREQATHWAQNMYVRHGGPGRFVYEFELEIYPDFSCKLSPDKSLFDASTIHPRRAVQISFARLRPVSTPPKYLCLSSR